LVPTLVTCPFRQIALGTFGSGGWRPRVPACLPSNEEPSGSEGRALESALAPSAALAGGIHSPLDGAE
jgi:hypothetical protein